MLQAQAKRASTKQVRCNLVEHERAFFLGIVLDLRGIPLLRRSLPCRGIGRQPIVYDKGIQAIQTVQA